MIPFLELKKITDRRSKQIHRALARVTDSGWYLHGRENEVFERHYAEYIGVSHCVGVANGLDALTLILRAWIETGRLAHGDEVIVPANTYIASIIAITENGLRPVLVEPRPDTCQIDDRLIEAAITPRTRALMIVHLYGRCAYTDRIGGLCRDHGLRLVEDNAQAAGCLWQGRYRTGSLGTAAGHSFYPGKNLGALGDAGAVTTDDDDTGDGRVDRAAVAIGDPFELQKRDIHGLAVFSLPSARPSSSALPTTRRCRAGLPHHTVRGGTSRVTTLPAPTIASSPMVLPAMMVALAPIEAPRLTSVGTNPPVGRRPERGNGSLVKATPGPTKTSSSSRTPSQS
jgi:hypothetical protein